MLFGQYFRCRGTLRLETACYFWKPRESPDSAPLAGVRTASTKLFAHFPAHACPLPNHVGSKPTPPRLSFGLMPAPGLWAFEVGRVAAPPAQNSSSHRPQRPVCGGMGTAPLIFPVLRGRSLPETQVARLPFPSMPRNSAPTSPRSICLLSCIYAVMSVASICGSRALQQPACLLTAPQFPHGDPLFCHCG